MTNLIPKQEILFMKMREFSLIMIKENVEKDLCAKVLFDEYV